MDMNFLDIVVLALVLFLGLKGLVRGLIKEVFGLISIVGGVFLASRFAEDMGGYIHGNLFPVENEGVRTLVGFVLLFAAIWILIQLTGSLLAKIIMVSGLGFVDKIGGLAVGAAKIFLVFSIITYGFSSVSFIKEMLDSKFQNSFMYPLLLKTGGFIVSIDTASMNEAKEKIKSESEKLTGELAKGAIEGAVSDLNGTARAVLDELNASQLIQEAGKPRD